jgi:hypothetical protein
MSAPKKAPRKRADGLAVPVHFPAPGPEPRFPNRPPRDERERAKRQRAFEDWGIRDAVYRAVHRNDPFTREVLSTYASELLLADLPLEPPLREWVAWVCVHLRDRDQVPHMARGNAVKTRARYDLERRVVQTLLQLPPEPVPTQLGEVADRLNVSVEKVKAIYYSIPASERQRELERIRQLPEARRPEYYRIPGSGQVTPQ